MAILKANIKCFQHFQYKIFRNLVVELTEICRIAHFFISHTVIKEKFNPVYPSTVYRYSVSRAFLYLSKISIKFINLAYFEFCPVTPVFRSKRNSIVATGWKQHQVKLCVCSQSNSNLVHRFS